MRDGGWSAVGPAGSTSAHWIYRLGDVRNASSDGKGWSWHASVERAGNPTAAYSAKIRAIVVPRSMPGSAKLTDRSGILRCKSVVEYVQIANGTGSGHATSFGRPVFGRDVRRAIGDTRTCD
jgi:hypothetical protein